MGKRTEGQPDASASRLSVIEEPIHFVIPGPPTAKGRPRFAHMKTKRGKHFTRTYSDKETASFENLVKIAYWQQRTGKPSESAIFVVVTYYLPIPKSWPKYRREWAQHHPYPVTKRPDLDNLTKSVLDGLNGVAFQDDAQVYRIITTKLYSDNPRTEVTVRFAPNVERKRHGPG